MWDKHNINQTFDKNIISTTTEKLKTKVKQIYTLWDV